MMKETCAFSTKGDQGTTRAPGVLVSLIREKESGWRRGAAKKEKVFLTIRAGDTIGN
jgi:hypothetical protein